MGPVFGEVSHFGRIINLHPKHWDHETVSDSFLNCISVNPTEYEKSHFQKLCICFYKSPLILAGCNFSDSPTTLSIYKLQFHISQCICTAASLVWKQSLTQNSPKLCFLAHYKTVATPCCKTFLLGMWAIGTLNYNQVLRTNMHIQTCGHWSYSRFVLLNFRQNH